MKYILFIFSFFSFAAQAQIVDKAEVKNPPVKKEDTLVIDSGKKDSLKIFKPTIEDYQFQTQFSEKKVFDTVMTFDKTHIFLNITTVITLEGCSLPISVQDSTHWYLKLIRSRIWLYCLPINLI